MVELHGTRRSATISLYVLVIATNICLISLAVWQFTQDQIAGAIWIVLGLFIMWQAEIRVSHRDEAAYVEGLQTGMAHALAHIENNDRRLTYLAACAAAAANRESWWRRCYRLPPRVDKDVTGGPPDIEQIP